MPLVPSQRRGGGGGGVVVISSRNTEVLSNSSIWSRTSGLQVSGETAAEAPAVWTCVLHPLSDLEGPCKHGDSAMVIKAG